MSKGKLNNDIINEIKRGFQMKCIHILIDGYNEMYKKNSYDVDWEEERITAELIKYIKLAPRRLDWNISVVPEPRIYSEEVYNDTIAPKEAPRIDMQFLSWSYSNELIYHIEAKNLAANNWTKTDGSHVISSYLISRYIETGIENFINDRYKEGCLAGYVLQGTASDVVTRINRTISEREQRPLEVLTNSHPINGHDLCYIS